MRSVNILVLLLALASIRMALGNTPAFNPTLRTDSVLGDWRLVLNTALYDLGEYEFQRGFGYVEAGTLFAPAETSTSDRQAMLELEMQRQDIATQALTTAVTLDPANAHAWASLAWVRSLSGDDAAAMSALRTSWDLAPFNVDLADTRLNLAGLLVSSNDGIEHVSEDDQAFIINDIWVLNRFDRSTHNYYQQSLPDLQRLFHAAQSANPPES